MLLGSNISVCMCMYVHVPPKPKNPPETEPSTASKVSNCTDIPKVCMSFMPTLRTRKAVLRLATGGGDEGGGDEGAGGIDMVKIYL